MTRYDLDAFADLAEQIRAYNRTAQGHRRLQLMLHWPHPGGARLVVANGIMQVFDVVDLTIGGVCYAVQAAWQRIIEEEWHGGQ